MEVQTDNATLTQRWLKHFHQEADTGASRDENQE